jgi:inhibitor of KinA sporulation pathway (predicted exonuclease)
VIELPLVVVDVRQPLARSATSNPDGYPGTVAAAFRTYCRPVIHPKLTDFCTSLTGITQEQVDEAPLLEEVLPVMDAWVRTTISRLSRAPPHSVRAPRNSDGSLTVQDAAALSTREGAVEAISACGLALSEEEAAGSPLVALSAAELERVGGLTLPPFAFVCDGPWDIKHFLWEECHRKGLLETHWPQSPAYWDSWVNLRWLFCEACNGGKSANLSGMLGKLGMSFEGREHSGLDDSVNISRIARAMLARAVRLSVNEGLSPSVALDWHRWAFFSHPPKYSPPMMGLFFETPTELSPGAIEAQRARQRRAQQTLAKLERQAAKHTPVRRRSRGDSLSTGEEAGIATPPEGAADHKPAVRERSDSLASGGSKGKGRRSSESRRRGARRPAEVAAEA